MTKGLVVLVTVLFGCVAMGMGSSNHGEKWERSHPNFQIQNKLDKMIFTDWNHEEMMKEEVKQMKYKRDVQRVQIPDPQGKRDVHSFEVTYYPIPFVDLSVGGDGITVYGVDYYGDVYVSFDSMIHWNETTIPSADGVFAAYPSSADSQTVFFLANPRGNFTTNWLTQDNGKTFRAIKSSVALRSVKLHPVSTLYMLGISGNNELLSSANFGETWTSIRDKLVTSMWCPTSTAPYRICMVTDVDAEELGLPDSTTDSSVGKARFVTTEDFGQTITVALKHSCSSVVRMAGSILAICYDDHMARDDLFISTDSGSTFHKAILPTGDNVPYLYPEQLLDDSFGAAWLGINHNPLAWGSPHYGNIYVANTDGWKFDLALEHVVNLNNWWDFGKVQSLEGTYIANVLVSWQDDSANFYNANPLVKTQITYDNGNTWNRLTPPAYDSNGVPIECTGTCSLNLFGVTTWLGIGGASFYGDYESSPTAVGLIIGTGNVGDYLQFQPEAVNTYLSRDGGRSWVEIMKGSTVFDYGDSGGVLLLIKNQVPTNQFYFTLTEGLFYYTINFTNTPCTVINAFSINPLIGRIEIFGRLNGYPAYFGVDLTQIAESPCTDSDYETWTPSSNCVLGHDIVYKRRQRTAHCLNPDDMNPVVSVSNCNCTNDDYECDYGYDRTLHSNICVKTQDTTDYDIEAMQIQCEDPSNGGYYYTTQGYRLIPGDTCVNHIPKYAPVKTACPSQPSTSTTSSNTANQSEKIEIQFSSGLIALITVLTLFFLIGGIFVGVIIGARSVRLHNLLRSENRNQGNNYAVVEQEHDEE